MLGELLRDLTGNPVPSTTRFTTQSVELLGTDYNEVSRPDAAVMAGIFSNEAFTIAEADDADGVEILETVSVPVGKMSSVWIKGAAGQSVRIMWEYV